MKHTFLPFSPKTLGITPPCLKLVKIMVETSNLARKYTHIRSFTKYTRHYTHTSTRKMVKRDAIKYKNSQNRSIRSCGFNFFRTVLILNKFKPTILGQFIKSSNFVVNLAKKSLVSTKGTLGSALETSSEKRRIIQFFEKISKNLNKFPCLKIPKINYALLVFREDIQKR